MKTMWTSLNFDKDTVKIRLEDGVTKLLLAAEGMQEHVLLSSVFTSNRELDDNGEDTDDEQDSMESSLREALLLTLSEVGKDSQKMNEEVAVSTASNHLSNTERRMIQSALFAGGSVVVWTLENFTLSDVPCRHSFELKEYQPTNYPVQRMTAKHSQIAKKEVKTCCGCILLNRCVALGRYQ